MIPDFRWPEQRLVLEADGAAWHDNAIARADDLERQALLEATGERVIRVTWHQAVTRSAETVDRIRAAGAPCLPCSAGPGPYSVGCEECAVPTSAAMRSSRSTSAR